MWLCYFWFFFINITIKPYSRRNQSAKLSSVKVKCRIFCAFKFYLLEIQECWKMEVWVLAILKFFIFKKQLPIQNVIYIILLIWIEVSGFFSHVRSCYLLLCTNTFSRKQICKHVFPFDYRWKIFWNRHKAMLAICKTQHYSIHYSIRRNKWAHYSKNTIYKINCLSIMKILEKGNFFFFFRRD